MGCGKGYDLIPFYKSKCSSLIGIDISRINLVDTYSFIRFLIVTGEVKIDANKVYKIDEIKKDFRGRLRLKWFIESDESFKRRLLDFKSKFRFLQIDFFDYPNNTEHPKQFEGINKTRWVHLF